MAAVMLHMLPNQSFGQAPTLGVAAGFVLFTTIGPVTNSGIPYLTHLTGNVGTNTGSSTGFGNVDGQMHDGGPTSIACAADVIALYGDLNGRTPTFSPPSPLLGGGETLSAGVYQYPLLTAASLNLNLFLDGAGDPNALFIIKIDGAFSVNTGAKVVLLNGALACNVFWLVEGMIGMGAGATMRGTMLAHNGQILLGALDTLEGRALSINGEILTNSLMAYTPLGCGSPVLTGPAAPSLVSTASFGVFSSIGPVTSTPVTYVLGDVGSNTAGPTGFDPLNVTGDIYTPGAVTATCAADLLNVYNYMNALPTDIELLYPALFGHDLVLTPHTYHMAAAPISLTGSVYLNAQGNPNAVFVINMNGAFITSLLSKIILINGTQAKNVYWKIDGAVHIYDNSVFNGTIIAAGAIDLDTGDTLNGRAMTINGAVAINGSYINVNPAPCVASSITGIDSVCVGMTTLLTSSDTGRIWHSSDTAVATIDSVSGLVTGVAAGTTIITLTTGLACQNVDTVTVNAAPLPVTGADTVCAGSATLYSSLTPGGSWSSSNLTAATVGSLSGLVSGIAAGTADISYTIAGGCSAMKNIVVNSIPAAGTITGTFTVCPAANTLLSNTTLGGIWSSVTPAIATIGSLTGLLTGVVAGTTTISYTVTNTCGASAATTIVTVNPAPDAGTITGIASTCPTGTTTLSNTAIGGVWSSVTPAIATIGSLTGIVSGIATGTTTISYTVTNSCGTAAATVIVTVSATPDAGTIAGTTIVCAGSTTTLTNTAGGGVWSSVTPAIATIGSASGIVTGIAAGTTAISYTVTNSCGTNATSTVVTVNPLPEAGTITGIASTCPTVTTTLSNTAIGGVWSSVTPAIATIGSLTGIVTGIATGTTTISYTVTNSCGTAAATRVVTVSATPDAGTITGTTILCAGSTTTLTNTAGGGVWSSVTPATATIGSASGTVTGIAAGTSTISYTVTNSCGTNATSTVVTVNPLPVAGTITGTASTCPTGTTTLSNTASGGVWSSVTPAVATIGSLTGIVTGIATGTTTISYTVTNSCGTAVTTVIVTISATPDAGTITGTAIVCAGSTTTLTNTAGGGVWVSVTPAIATIGSASGIVTGMAAGTTIVSYTVTNSCGSASSFRIVTVNPLPFAGIITGTATVCQGNTITLNSTVGGGIWTSASTLVAAIGSLSGIVTGANSGTALISYSFTNSCGTNVATRVVTVSPMPNAGTIIGLSRVCTGSSISLTNMATGGIWSTNNANTSVSSGLVTGIFAGIDTIVYTVTNSCGSATAIKIITVNPLPGITIITTSSPAIVCNGTMYQNFGTSTPVAADRVYNWSAVNATVWAQGSSHNYALVNFNLTGTAYVTLNTTISSTGCTSTNTQMVTVNASPAQVDYVSYFKGHFVSTPNGRGSYQWGYDDKTTLDSTILVGEINQDYVHASPDFNNRLFWVMTNTGGCIQKTYYTAPLVVESVSEDGPNVKVYPNPATSQITVEISANAAGTIVVEIANIMGQKMTSVTASNSKALVDVTDLAAGPYIVTCYSDGIRISSTRFIKN